MEVVCRGICGVENELYLVGGKAVNSLGLESKALFCRGRYCDSR